MNLLMLLTNRFILSDDDIYFIKSMKSFIFADNSFSCQYIISKKCSLVLHESSIHQNIAESNHKLIIGVKNLITNLGQYEPNDIVQIEHIDSDHWSGSIYSIKNTFIGIILGEKPPKSFITPPNWDGGVDSLTKYNQ